MYISSQMTIETIAMHGTSQLLLLAKCAFQQRISRYDNIASTSHFGCCNIVILHCDNVNVWAPKTVAVTMNKALLQTINEALLQTSFTYMHIYMYKF